MKQLRIGVIGYGFMGRMHSHAWRVASGLFELPVAPVLHTLCGRDAVRLQAVANRFGYLRTTSDWRTAVADDEIDLIVICTPGGSHAEIAEAALAAGKHVLCEKPLANSLEEAAGMRASAAASERIALIGFNYRQLPAVRLARRLVREGAIGRHRYVRAQFLQDWLSDENAPMTWRLQKEGGGSGALGDLGSHTIDLVQYALQDRVAQVNGVLRTAVPRRSEAGTGRMLPVEVDDTAVFSGSLESGALASFEVSRVATGRKCAFGFEIYGETGALRFDFEDLNYLQVQRAAGPQSGFARVHATGSGMPFGDDWWPVGHGLGYDAGFIHQNVEIARLVAGGSGADLADFGAGYQVQQVLDAVERSADAGGCSVAVG